LRFQNDRWAVEVEITSKGFDLQRSLYDAVETSKIPLDKLAAMIDEWVAKMAKLQKILSALRDGPARDC
jgi:hypothetical protein